MRRRDKEKGGSGTEIAPLPNTNKSNRSRND
jgi:hypothetical protein